MNCPWCGKYGAPDPETGYDGDDFCSAACEEAFLRNRAEEDDDPRTIDEVIGVELPHERSKVEGGDA